jgi:YVTN family beta-propeller protein
MAWLSLLRPTIHLHCGGGIVAILLGIVLLAGLPFVVCLAQPDADATMLRAVGDYRLPRRPTRWDYITHDVRGSRMFIAHLGDSAVVVVDTKTKDVIATIPDVGQVHGTLFVPELNRVYASATGTNEVVAIDAGTLKIIARMPGGVYPDGIAYAPDVRKLYVSDENGNTETVIDTRSNRRIATIELGGSVGNSQYDPVSGHIFVNVQGTRELVEIDPVSDTVVRHFPLMGAVGNHGLLIDAAHRLAFIACEGNDRLLVMDLNSKKVVGRLELGKEPDVLAFDEALGWLYVASESGVLARFRVGAGGVTPAGREMVGPNAHTVALDPSSHELYMPINLDGHKPVLRVLKPEP